MGHKRLPRVGFVSLGCPKNLVDSERIVTNLRAEGYVISSTYQDSDLVIVNTCGFIDAAIEESLAAITEALQENGKVIVTGCLGNKVQDGTNFIESRFPNLLAVTGPEETDKVLGVVHANLKPPHEPFDSLVPGGRVLLTSSHYAYLKIAEGCNHHCTFCIIPSLRGKLVSRPIGKIMREAEQLVKNGVKELLVIAQDTAAYGVDVRYKLDFIGGRVVKTKVNILFDELSKLGVWIRPHYLYPYPSVDELVHLMAEGKVLPYLDIPFQHAHPRILKAMKRPGSENNLERILAWRKICPDLTIRSTFITGFPGETEAEFGYLLDFLKEAKLDCVGCFAYSPVEGATANDLPNPVAEEVKEERRHRLMQLQSEISTELLKKKHGTEETVLVDKLDYENGVAIARTKGQSPDIDGVVYIQDNPQINVGDFVKVKIVDSNDFDLFAKLSV